MWGLKLHPIHTNSRQGGRHGRQVATSQNKWELRCKGELQMFIFPWDNHRKYVAQKKKKSKTELMIHRHITGIHSLYVCLEMKCAWQIVHKTGIKSNSSGQSRSLFIKSYIFRSVLSDYTQSYSAVPAVIWGMHKQPFCGTSVYCSAAIHTTKKCPREKEKDGCERIFERVILPVFDM